MRDLTPEYVKRPERYHLLLFGLYFVAIFQALWQHGHPEFTFALISLAILAPVVGYLPDAVFPPSQRRVAQGFAAVAGLLWIGGRLANKTPADLALLEGLACMSLAFAFSRKAEEFPYLLLASIIMVGYGSVVPARPLYVALLPVSAGLALAALYHSRASALADRPFGLPKQAFRLNNWPVLATHVAIFALAWGTLFVLFPSSNRQGPGIVGVSYETNNVRLVAPLLQNWLPAGKGTTPGANGLLRTEGDNSPEHDPNATTLVQGQWQKPGANGGGGGGGTPSDDVVMRVKSPARLYWVGRIYDRYDGRKWHQGRPTAATNERTGYQPTLVPQTFVIEKWISRSLFAAYRPLGYATPREQGQRLGGELHDWGRRFPDNQPLPPLPYQYSVRSQVNPVPTEPSPFGKPTAAPGPSRATRKLPQAVSKRVRDLAKRITADADTPLAKATALRDYLRRTYAYEQFSRKVPDGREPVDFFLFELDRGHCEYFAAALAVLARAVGLHARVVTGFSPGDYNTLTGCFEVKESHAHAWTQIYVPDHHWLTFDATPPGSIESRVTPAVIGSFRDPFSDDWQITPPELSRDVVAFRKQTLAETSIGPNGGRATRGPNLSLVSRIAMNVPTSLDEAKSIWRRWTRQITTADGRRTTRLARAVETITTNLKNMLSRTLDIVNAVADAITLQRFFGLAAAAALLTISIIGGRRLQRQIIRQRRLRRCREWWRLARHLTESDPSKSIEYCYRMIRELLRLADVPKPAGDDLIDYGRSLNQRMPTVSHDVLAVFDLYSLLRYGDQAPTSREARAALMRASCARDLLLEKLR